MKKPKPVHCAKEGCGKVWPRDPVLEVKCPVDVCQAAVGHECTVMKPSGHRLNKNFAGLPPWGHDERDLLADREGKYGVCPLGICGVRSKDNLKTERPMGKEAKGEKGGAFMKPVQPDAALAAIVGGEPQPRTEITKKLWAYIKANSLQDSTERRIINADAKLKPVFDGKDRVSMFEMTALVSAHIIKED